MPVPQINTLQEVPNMEQPEMNPSYVRFYKDRKKAKKCGKVLMYIGYFLVIGSSISIFKTMLNVFGVYLDDGKRYRDLKMFTAGQLALGYAF